MAAITSNTSRTKLSGTRAWNRSLIEFTNTVRRPAQVYGTGDHRSAIQALEEALGIYHDIGDRQGQANALTDLAVVRLTTGDHRSAIEVLREALSIYRHIGHRHRVQGTTARPRSTTGRH